MPFIPNTPESLLTHSDPRGPASTCRGLTATGQPCRRTIGGSPRSRRSTADSPTAANAEMYCFSHKNQAASLSEASPRSQSTAVTRRASVETLVDRLGLLDVDDQDEHRENTQPLNSQRRQNERPARSEDHTRRPRPNPDRRSSLALLCLLGPTDHPEHAPRPVRRQDQQQPRASAPMPPRRRIREIQTDHARAMVHSNQVSRTPNSSSAPPSQPPISPDPSSRTDEFLSLIPRTASPQTTSRLLLELDRPVSISDVPGYIYVYWIAPESLSPLPPAEVASSLFEVSTTRPGHRRTSELLQGFSTTRDGKILIKIGQTVNVQRRLNQWSSQCGHNLSVVRCYPYRPSSPSPARGQSPTQVPFARKVERLIHIELAASRAQDIGRCHCNREHREWFEVEASRQGIAAVDEVIRRWVDWGLRARS